MSRLHHLDAMRGLAAIGVIYSHVAEYALGGNLVTHNSERLVLCALTEWINLGKVSVVVFFAISGAVIPLSLFKYDSRPLICFAISRICRLYPAYWLSIPFGLVLFYVLKNVPITPAAVATNVSMMQQFVGQPDIIGVYWTLQIEIIFYALCAAMFMAGKLDDRAAVTRAGLGFLACAVGLGLLRFLMEKKFPVALPLALAVMFWGLVVRYYWIEGRTEWKTTLAVLSVGLMLTIPVVSVLAYNMDMGFHETWYKYVASYYGAIALFILLFRICPIKNSAIVYLGRISYSVYLFGAVSQEFLVRCFGSSLFALSTHAVIAATMLLTIAFASLVYPLVEAPAIRLGKHLTTTIGNSQAAPALNTPTGLLGAVPGQTIER